MKEKTQRKKAQAYVDGIVRRHKAHGLEVKVGNGEYEKAVASAERLARRAGDGRVA